MGDNEGVVECLDVGGRALQIRDGKYDKGERTSEIKGTGEDTNEKR